MKRGLPVLLFLVGLSAQASSETVTGTYSSEPVRMAQGPLFSVFTGGNFIRTLDSQEGSTGGQLGFGVGYRLNSQYQVAGFVSNDIHTANSSLDHSTRTLSAEFSRFLNPGRNNGLALGVRTGLIQESGLGWFMIPVPISNQRNWFAGPQVAYEFSLGSQFEFGFKWAALFVAPMRTQVASSYFLSTLDMVLSLGI